MNIIFLCEYWVNIYFRKIMYEQPIEQCNFFFVYELGSKKKKKKKKKKNCCEKFQKGKPCKKCPLSFA